MHALFASLFLFVLTFFCETKPCNGWEPQWHLPAVQILEFTPMLASSVWKTLLKLMNSSAFVAKATLVRAIASCESGTWQPKGLLQFGGEGVQPYLSQLIGQAEGIKKSRYGFIGCTQRTLDV